jgi:hypothetical protein
MPEWTPVHDAAGKVVGWTMPPGPDGRYPEDTIPAILETRDGDPVGTTRLDVDYFGVVDPEMVPQEIMDAELVAWWEE